MYVKVSWWLQWQSGSSEKQIKQRSEKAALKAADAADPLSYQLFFCPAPVYKVWAHETLKSLIIPHQWTPLLKAALNVTEFTQTSVPTISLVSHVSHVLVCQGCVESAAEWQEAARSHSHLSGGNRLSKPTLYFKLDSK